MSGNNILEQQTNNARQEKEQMVQYWLQAKQNWNNLCKGRINKENTVVVLSQLISASLSSSQVTLLYIKESLYSCKPLTKKPFHVIFQQVL